MRVMIAGGGTGGHTSPAAAVVEELRRRCPEAEFEWVGRRNGLEQRVAATHEIAFRAVPVRGWPRKRTWRKGLVVTQLACSIGLCWVHLKRFRPDIVFGVGGYVSLPLLYAAQRSGFPTAIHEQNRLLGMANRMLARRAKRVFLSYADTVGAYPAERALLVGNPVRARFLTPPEKAAACQAFELDTAIPTVLVCGGSQGARSLNQAVADALPRFGEHELQVIWMTGSHGEEQARAAAAGSPVNVKVFPFIDDMVGACAAADLVVSRSGASTTAELAVLGKPSVLVPFPHATDNHQEQNARAFEEAGAAVVVLDSELDGDRFAGTVRGLLGDTGRLEAMESSAAGLARPGAAEAIVDSLLELTGR